MDVFILAEEFPHQCPRLWLLNNSKSQPEEAVHDRPLMRDPRSKSLEKDQFVDLALGSCRVSGAAGLGNHSSAGDYSMAGSASGWYMHEQLAPAGVRQLRRCQAFGLHWRWRIPGRICRIWKQFSNCRGSCSDLHEGGPYVTLPFLPMTSNQDSGVEQACILGFAPSFSHLSQFRVKFASDGTKSYSAPGRNGKLRFEISL